MVRIQVLVFVDDEQFGDPIAGILQDILDDGAGPDINGLNLVGLEPGEQVIRIEELNNGTLEELTLTVYDSPPFPDNPVDINNIQCAQREIGEDGNCEMAVSFGANAGASTYLVFLNDAMVAETLPPGIIFGGMESGEYCINLQGSWTPPDAAGNRPPGSPPRPRQAWPSRWPCAPAGVPPPGGATGPWYKQQIIIK